MDRTKQGGQARPGAEMIDGRAAASGKDSRKGSHVLVSTRHYRDAQRTVDSLADKGFPVEHLTIVAEGLRFVEDVTGRTSYWTAAWQGLISGGLIGAVLGLFFGAFSWVDPLVSSLALATYGFLLGAAAGMVVRLLSHSIGGLRDYSSTGRMEASSYDVMCDDEAIEEARGALVGKNHSSMREKEIFDG